MEYLAGKGAFLNTQDCNGTVCSVTKGKKGTAIWLRRDANLKATNKAGKTPHDLATKWSPNPMKRTSPHPPYFTSFKISASLTAGLPKEKVDKPRDYMYKKEIA